MAGIRSFIAIDVEDENICNHIRLVQQDLLATEADLRLIKPENLHFTLHFLGNIEPERISELKVLIQEIAVSSFDCELTGLGCFRPARPRIVWIGVAMGAEGFIRLQQQVGKQLHAQSFPVERRKYSPHLTIARVRSGANRKKLITLLDQHSNLEFGKMPVREVKLKKSTLTPRGPIYEDLEVKRLTQTANQQSA